MRRDDLGTIVNAAVNQMLDRTMITGCLTLLSVIALYLFGGEVLRGFGFTMIVGIITGTYSSVFIAAAIVVPMLIPLETYKAQALAGIEQATGRKARIDGEFKFSVLPTFKFTAGKVALANAPGAQPAQTAATARSPAGCCSSDRRSRAPCR